MRQIKLNEQERAKRLNEAINYFKSNGYGKELIKSYKRQLKEVVAIVNRDKKKRKAFVKSLELEWKKQ